MNKDITLEDLGYKKLKTKNKYRNSEITYVKEDEYNFKVIEFFDKKITINEDDEYSPELSIEELQAIYNKCKELKKKLSNQSFIETIEKIGNDSSKTKDDMIINYENDIKYYKEIINYIEEKGEVINEAIKYIKDNLVIASILDGKKTYCLNLYSFEYEELLEILKRGKNGK